MRFQILATTAHFNTYYGLILVNIKNHPAKSECNNIIMSLELTFVFELSFRVDPGVLFLST